jgi:UV DNA damage endonuclease
MSPNPTIRLGLCCQWLDTPIKFRTTTASVVDKPTAEQRAAKLGEICRHNAVALLEPGGLAPT